MRHRLSFPVLQNCQVLYPSVHKSLLFLFHFQFWGRTDSKKITKNAYPMWHINPTKILIQCFSFHDSFLSYILLKKNQICLSLWLIRLLSTVKCDFQMKMKMNNLEELSLKPLSPPATILLAYCFEVLFLFLISTFSPKSALYQSSETALMRLTTSELTNLVGEFLELIYTWPLSSKQTTLLYLKILFSWPHAL